MKNKIVEVEYVSLWNNGIEVVTTAKYDSESGVVYDIETTDENLEELDTLEREFIRFENGVELNVSNGLKGCRVIDFAEILEDICGSEQAFVEGEQYVAFDEVLINFADDHGVNLIETDIEVLFTSMGIDADGYPFVKKDIEITKYGCRVVIIACHHWGWDFYVEEFKLLKK